MPTSSLPTWAQWFAALAPATAAVVTGLVAIVVAIIAYRQWRVAKDKLVLDLFDRRMAVYSGVMEAIRLIVAHGGTGQVVTDAQNAILDAWWASEFLFGQDVRKSIEKVVDLIMSLRRGTTPETVFDDGEFEKMMRTVAAVEASREGFPPVFAPYMRMDQKR